MYSLSLTRTMHTLHTLRTRLAHHRRLSTTIRTSSVHSVIGPPPHLVIIVSRFRTLGSRLPSCIGHLIHVTSLNESLNVCLVTYARGPVNRIDTSVGTGVSIDVYLQIQSHLRSYRLLNSNHTTSLDPTVPNTTFYGSSRRIATFHYTATHSVSTIYHRVTFTSQFIKDPPRPSLFATPLPQRMGSQAITSRTPRHVQFKLTSSNVGLQRTAMSLANNGVNIVNPRKHNGAALLGALTQRTDVTSNLTMHIDSLRHQM